MEEILALAKEPALTLNEADLEKPAVQELDDDDLDAVAGGGDVSCACAMGGSTKDNNDKTCACVLAGAGYSTNGCEHALQGLAGCRASALEAHPAAIFAPDSAACAIFKGGWVERIRNTMQEVAQARENSIT